VGIVEYRLEGQMIVTTTETNGNGLLWCLFMLFILGLFQLS